MLNYFMLYMQGPPYAASQSEKQVYWKPDTAHPASLGSVDEPFQQQQPQTGEISAITDPGVVSLSLQFVLLALQLNSAY